MADQVNEDYTIDAEITLKVNVPPHISENVTRVMVGDQVFTPEATVFVAPVTVVTVPDKKATKKGAAPTRKSPTPAAPAKVKAVCKKCEREFTYVKKSCPRKYCDDCQQAYSKPKPKAKASFGAKGASTGVDQNAATNLNQHHLGKKLAVSVGD